MKDSLSDINYVYEAAPTLGKTIEVAPGVHWLRMPLPFKLDHINLWLLEDNDEDGDGWTIVDTGINLAEVRDAWKIILSDRITELKPLKRVVVTHFHPDHFGLAGWLIQKFSATLWMPREEWAQAQILSMETNANSRDSFSLFYHAAGFNKGMLKKAKERPGRYSKLISCAPASFIRIVDGQEISINGLKWRTIIGAGHSPEHACLYSPELDVLISGDQVLPKITPNISVWPQEPKANPLEFFLTSLEKLRGLGSDTLVLPSHKLPFRGLDKRIDELQSHHFERLDEIVNICSQRSNGVEVMHQLFQRELDDHQMFFAIGETLAHLNYLVERGKILLQNDSHGVNSYHHK
jgi:glyoxylase-like metal-dependent hydrolase (beta-lactamase superfamily II)